MVFVDQDLGTGVNEKRYTGDPSLEWNKGALFAEKHVYISSYKAALGSKKKKKKKKLSKNKAKQITIFEGPESIACLHNWEDHISVKSLEGVTEGTKQVTFSQDLSPRKCMQLCSFLQQLMRNRESLRNGTQKKRITYWIPKSWMSPDIAPLIFIFITYFYLAKKKKRPYF